MTDASYAGALRAGSMEFTESRPTPAAHSPGRNGLRRAWGVVCGTTFIAARSCVYLIALPVAGAACLVGIALHGVQSLTGIHHG